MSYTTTIDLPAAPDYLPTAEVPTVTEEMRKLLKHLDGGTLSGVTDQLLEIADKKMKRNRLATSEVQGFRNSRWFTDLEESPEIATLLIHSMPKSLIRAVVFGVTEACSRLSGDDEMVISRDMYAYDGPGTYMAVVAVAGRDGKAYTGNELKEVLVDLKWYLRAEKYCRERSRSRGSRSRRSRPRESESKKKLMTFAAEVNDEYGTSELGNTMFIRTSRHRRKIQQMVKQLRMMAKDAKPDVPIAQLPGYCGCASKHIDQRSRSHDHESGWSKSKGNYCHWLLMSIIKHRGITPEVIVTPIFRTWEDGQLAVSETLGHLLGMGGTWVEDWGLNVSDPGTRKDKVGRDWCRDEIAATYYRQHLKNNLDENISELRSRLRILEELGKDHISSNVISSTDTTVADYEAVAKKTRNVMRRTVEDLAAGREEVQQYLDNLQEVFEEQLCVEDLARLVASEIAMDIAKVEPEDQEMTAADD